MTFSTTKKMLQAARNNPSLLKSKWTDFYYVDKESPEYIVRFTTYSPCKTGYESEFPIKGIDETNQVSSDYSLDIFYERCKPIPCPHFIYITNLSINNLSAASNVKSKVNVGTPITTQHREIFCIQNAYLLTEDEVYRQIAKYCADSLQHSLSLVLQEATSKIVISPTEAADAQFIALFDQLLPSILFEYMRYVAEHASRGLLNKELFD